MTSIHHEITHRDRPANSRTTRTGKRQLAIALVALLASGQQHAALAEEAEPENDTDPALEAVVVAGESPTAEAEKRLSRVAGGTSVVDGETLQRGRIGNIADALVGQPGVLAKSTNGGEAVRLSIRGSGISRGSYFWGTGLQTQIDGFTITGPAGSPYESFEPLVLERVEILRGANGFAYGPLSLGGVVNYVSRTGHNASPFQIRLETGSYGYARQQVSSGQVLGPLDYYFSLTGFQQDGFRDNSKGDSKRAVFNVGYKINDDIETRFYFRHSQQWQVNPGFVTWQQVKQDRKASQYAIREENVRYNPGSTSIANRTTWQINDDSSLKVGVQWREYTLEPDSSRSAGWDTGWWFKELNTFATYERGDQIFGGRQSNTTASLFYNRIISADAKGYTQGGGADGTLAGQESYGGSDLIAVLQNDLEIDPGLWLTLGVSGIKQERDISIKRSLAWDTGAPRSKSFDYNSISPRIGLRYELTPGAQIFANISRSYEAPTLTNYSAAVLGLPYIPEVSAQKANTLELGTSGKQDGLAWSLSWYYSRIKDELLSTQYTTPTGYIATGISNASDTIHQGVEASLDNRLWKSSVSSSEIKLRQAYTWSDFRYRDDSVFGSNTLPAIPEHFYQGQITYLHHSGLYLGANLEANLKRYAADYANTIHAKRYAILGLRGGYSDPRGRWEIYAQADNITDKDYPAVVNPIYNANGVDSQVYAIGVGRSFTLGASFNY